MISKLSQASASQKAITKKKHSAFPYCVPLENPTSKKATILWKGRAKPSIFRMWKWKFFLYHLMPCTLHTIRNLEPQKDKTPQQSSWGWNLRYKHLPFCSRSWGIDLNLFPSITSVSVANVDEPLLKSRKQELPHTVIYLGLILPYKPTRPTVKWALSTLANKVPVVDTETKFHLAKILLNVFFFFFSKGSVGH